MTPDAIGDAMQGNELLDDAFTRISGAARGAVEGLASEALVWQVEPGSNPIGWLVWHLTRVQDDHVAELAGREQEWVAQRWASRFGLTEGTTETGYGQTAEQVQALRPDGADTLVAYLEAVTGQTRAFLGTLVDGDLDRVVDTRWDPPVTMGVRLVSVIEDGLQHAGQAAYLRGAHERMAQAG